MNTVCITVDCDGHGFDIPDALKACVDFFDKHGISRPTWFVNERDYKYTTRFPSILEQMSLFGEIGVHTHLNGLWKYGRCIPDDCSLIYSAIRNDKQTLEKWLFARGYRKPIISFRSGNLLTNRALFEAIYRLGFKVDSSIAASFEWSVREVGRRLVLKAPPGLRNTICEWMKCCAYPTVRIDKTLHEVGGVIEIPLNIYVGGRYLDLQWLKRRSMEVLGHSKLLVVYFHPFDLIMSGTTTYDSYISWLLDTYNPRVSTVSEVYENYLVHHNV